MLFGMVTSKLWLLKRRVGRNKMCECIITIRDARKLKYCSRGIREFYDRHNLDYSDFIKNGISCNDLLKTGDSMAIKLVELVHGRR